MPTPLNAATSAREWLTGQLAIILDIDAATIADDKTFEELGADSLDTLELSMEAKDRFGIELSDDELAAIATFGQAIDLIDAKRNPAS